MSQTMQYEFHLFGPRAGKTMRINGHRFVNGVYRAVMTPQTAVSLTKVMGYYGAFAKGTPEFDRASKEANRGTNEVHEAAEQGSANEVSGNGESSGSRPSAPAADDGSGAESTSNDGSGGDPNRDGHGHSRVPKFEEAASIPQPSEPSSVGSEQVKAAVLKLDPQNDDHWVKTGPAVGKPKLSAVEDAYGKAGLTRQDLEAAIPGWNRDRAVEAALEG